MTSVNKVILIGNLGRDPEVQNMPNGSAVCTLSLATTRNWKSRETQERQEETEWHRVVLYERLAEVAGEFLRKGRAVYIEGRLKTKKWTDKEGVERYTTEVIADSMQLIGGREQSEGSEDEGRLSQQRQAPRGDGGGRQRQQPQGQPRNGGGGSNGGNGGGGYGNSQDRGYAQGNRNPRQPSRAPAPAGGFDDQDDDVPY